MSNKPNNVSGGTRNQAAVRNLTGWVVESVGHSVAAFRYSSAYLAVIAVVQVLLVTRALSLDVTFAPVVVGLVTFAVYLGDRIADADTDAETTPERAAFIQQHEHALNHAVSLSYGVAVALAVLGGPYALALTLLPGVFWVLYASNWLPTITAQFRRLKDVLLVNSLVVAFAWAVTLTALPLAFAGASVTPAAIVVFAYFFLSIFVNVEIPNVRDAEGDSAIGVETLPVVFGVTRTRRILYAIDIVTALIVVVAGAQGLLAPVFVAALLVGLAFSLCVTSLVGRTAHDDVLTLAAESEYLVVAIALIPAAL
ncbi:4-hydroxybenzoate polyprenyltransferase [Haloferax mucosum ATCC BAA-1512]|uniref:4-hydroxybenzoate polyprenyltransferase n=1 Tax=Haloferax mucosum ATCC BAA-1512 TaxID=662479 RepID=M0I579_9EURY|nr:UbiA family prenyltransferase [Haloferax mucosum]ELZ91940.1 4-hydroxybenzoate polyprenyltransferase [Haloferax mucosum ATCC BAA-1512]